MDAKKPRCQPRALLVGGVLSTDEKTKASSGQASRVDTCGASAIVEEAEMVQ